MVGRPCRHHTPGSAQRYLPTRSSPVETVPLSGPRSRGRHDRGVREDRLLAPERFDRMRGSVDPKLRIDQRVCFALEIGGAREQVWGTIDSTMSGHVIVRLANSDRLPDWLEPGQVGDLTIADHNGLHRGKVVVIRTLDSPCAALVVTLPTLRTTQNRESFRVPARLPCPYTIVESSNPSSIGMKDTFATSRDVSAGGIRIASRISVLVGDVIRIELTIQEDDSAVSVRIPPHLGVNALAGLVGAYRATASRPPNASASVAPAVEAVRRISATAPAPSRSAQPAGLPSTRAASRLGQSSPSHAPVITRADEPALEAEAEVVRVESLGAGDQSVAARFLRLPERDQTRLVRLVNDLQRKARGGSEPFDGAAR